MLEFSWAVSMVDTRSFNDELHGGFPHVAIGPVADMCNHDSDSSCRIAWDDQLDALVIKAQRQLRPGDEVYIHQ